ncbi:MAG: FAD-dependent monooxygenase [Chloroflexota bacterium]
MPNSYDAEVIVVGAGPAGATAATALAQQGHEVLLLDRSPFPRDKVCGDAISREVVSLLYSLGMKEKILKAEAQGEFYPLDSFRLVSPHLYSLDVPFPPNERTGAKSYVAPRIYLDATIQQHAIDNGATFAVADVKEPLVEDGVVTGVMAQMNGELRSLRSKIVIGADGVTSPIMRHLRPESEQHEDKHRAVALRAYVEGLDFHRPHEVEFFLYDEILPGYAWIFRRPMTWRMLVWVCAWITSVGSRAI